VDIATPPCRILSVHHSIYCGVPHTERRVVIATPPCGIRTVYIWRISHEGARVIWPCSVRRWTASIECSRRAAAAAEASGLIPWSLPASYTRHTGIPAQGVSCGGALRVFWVDGVGRPAIELAQHHRSRGNATLGDECRPLHNVCIMMIHNPGLLYPHGK
jgi:hypothetical protein